MLLLWFPFLVSLGWCLNNISPHIKHMLVLPPLIINSNDENHVQMFKEYLSSIFHLGVTPVMAANGTTEARTNSDNSKHCHLDFMLQLRKKKLKKVHHENVMLLSSKSKHASFVTFPNSLLSSSVRLRLPSGPRDGQVI